MSPRGLAPSRAGRALALAALAAAAAGCGGAGPLARPPAPARDSASTPAAAASVTWIGHATVLLRLGGATFLTDPVFGDLFGIVVRHDPPGIALGDLPHIDAILISHGHVDHLDPWTLGRLDHAATVVVPAGLEPRVRELGFGDVHGLRVWETVRVRGVRVTAVPAQHTRRSLGYLVGDGPTVYFAGDTGLFDGMGAIGDSARIDLALLPIGGYRPVLGLIPRPARALRRMHMTPDDVPAAAALLRPRLIVPIHWGTFRITAEPPDEPAARLRSIVAERGLGEAVRILAPGETLAF